MYLYGIFNLRTYLLLFIASFCSYSSLAQINKDRLFIKRFDLESGISQCVVTDMAEDKTGFIWISTYDGLNRFDGYNFKVFRYDSEDSTSIPATQVHKLFYDQAEHLWLYTDDNIIGFNIEKGKTSQNKIFKQNIFKSVCLANEKEVWVYDSKNILQLVDKTTFAVSKKSTPNTLITKDEEIISSFSKKDKVYLISKLGTVYTYDRLKKRWEKSEIDSADEISFSCAAFDEQETIFLGSMESDVLEYNVRQKQYITSPIHSLENSLLGVNYIKYDQANKAMLFSTYGQGIFSYDLSTRKLDQFQQGDEQLSLSSNYTNNTLRDKNGNLWIGYDGKGIDVLDANLKKFVAIKTNDERDEYNLKFVRRILEDQNGTIWIGTSGSGLVEYKRGEKQFTFHNKGPLEPTADNFILELIEVRNEIWLGLTGGGILIFDKDKKKITKKILPGTSENEIDGEAVWCMLFDKKTNQVWAGTTEKGIYKIDATSLAIKHYYSNKDPVFSDNSIRCFTQTSNNNFLVGTTKGILKLNPKKDRFERVYPTADSVLKSKHSIKCIHEDHKERLWLGTDGAGIFILDKNYSVVQTISTADKLNNNVVYSILPENKNSFWVSSNLGLSNINWTEKSLQLDGKFTIYNYESSSGLQGNEFNTNSYAKLADGSLAFGGLDGVNIFSGKDVRPSNIMPRVIITDFAVFSKAVDDSKLTSYIKNVKLKYNQNSFSLKFNTVGLTITDKIKYQYRLIGLNDDWVYADKRTYVSYTNLSPGDYEFQVKASNYDGYWSSEYTSIKIKITSPFYKSWWFILASLLIITFIVWSILNNRTKERNARQELKLEYTKEIAEVEMKALRAQINPHFLFNSLNSINNFILKNENKKARKYLVKFSQLVRSILNNSSSPYLSLREEIETIGLYVQIESMRFDNQFSFDVNIEEDINLNEILIPSLLLQPYIENAIWHGLLHKDGQKNIKINISKKDSQTVNITIDDNGIGREKAKKTSNHEPGRQSYGMQLGEDRLKLMNSENLQKGAVEVIDLYNETQEPIGTRIKISLPILDSGKYKRNNNQQTIS